LNSSKKGKFLEYGKRGAMDTQTEKGNINGLDLALQKKKESRSVLRRRKDEKKAVLA